MRGLLAAWVIVVVSSMTIVEADTKAANAANARGYALHKKKKYAEAAVEYRKAIAENTAHLLARYNLACVASLTKDADTAKEQLRWIADRSGWDKASAAVIKKAAKDRDLAWIRGLDEEEGSELAGGLKNTDLTPANVLDRGDAPSYMGKATTNAKLVGTMASAPGKHEKSCEATTFATTGEFMKGATVAANLRDGLFLINEKGTVIARTDPLGCASNRDSVHALVQADGDGRWSVSRQFVVQYSNRTEMKVAIYALVENKRFARVFDAEIMGFDGTGTLLITPLLKNLVFTATGTSNPVVYRWDPAATKYVLESS